MSTMKIHIDAMSDTFRRHRRNLMATSLLLCFMKYSGLVIRRITPMGTEIILDDEKAVFVMLWLLWFYFVVMYYQHFRQEAVAKLSRSWLSTVNERCKPKIESLVREAHPAVNPARLFQYSTLKKVDRFMKQYDGEESAGGGQFSMSIPSWQLWPSLIRSAFQVSVNQSTLMDYIFPWFLALGTLIYCHTGEWQGGIANVFG